MLHLDLCNICCNCSVLSEHQWVASWEISGRFGGHFCMIPEKDLSVDTNLWGLLHEPLIHRRTWQLSTGSGSPVLSCMWNMLSTAVLQLWAAQSREEIHLQEEGAAALNSRGQSIQADQGKHSFASALHLEREKFWSTWKINLSTNLKKMLHYFYTPKIGYYQQQVTIHTVFQYFNVAQYSIKLYK